jgi:adenylate cyclase
MMERMFKVAYQDGVSVEEDDPSLTLLQISLKHGIPHVHACGGHARCSTCRVMIREGLANVLARNEAEQRLAALKGFEPDVRLACQTCVTGPVCIRRLVLDERDAEIAEAERSDTTGCERSLAVLFSDIRDFTPFAEANLPYDVVHILNRYFLMMGDAVLQNGGYIDKYIGDGMMAVFGLSGGAPRDVCLAAVRSGLGMLENLAELNRYLKVHFDTEFGTRIGIHFGDMVVGQMGHPRKMQFTAIGDSVNLASRIETAVKVTTASLLVSEALHAHVKDDVQTGVAVDAVLKGKHGTYRLYEVVGLLPPLTREARSEPPASAGGSQPMPSP